MNPPLAPIDLAREVDLALGPAKMSPSLRQFTANGTSETVEPQVMKVLVSLARHAGEVIGRDDLVASCWDGRIIGEDAIQRAIAKVRKLGETSGAFAVETIPKVGYRLSPCEAAPGRTSPALNRNRSNLPRRIEALIGRDDDLALVADILREADLVTITGPGGIGKTRLAHEVGRNSIDWHENGAWLIELAPLNDPALVPGAIARVLGIRLSDPSDPLGELLARLTHWDALLVLDNCEHLVDAVAALVEPILRHAPRVKLLVSSQEPLGAEGERVLRLRSLGEADAAQLFATRARAADAGFKTPGNADAVRAICARLDGIPLAIEMAAARAPTLGCDHLLALLNNRFSVLTGGRRTALPRQRTLRATLEWSHSLLSEGEATVFRRLGVFIGGFALEAACDVANDERIDRSAVIDALASLVAKSLVVVDNENGGSRYRLLETTRAYAQERLAEAGEVRTIQHRHAIHFATSLEGSQQDFMGLMSDEALLARYGADIDNVTRALEWVFGPDGDGDLIAPLAANAVSAFARSSLIAEYAWWADLADEQLDASTPSDLRDRLLGVQAMMHSLADRGSALDLVERNIRAIRDSEDIASLFPALWAKALCLLEAGRLEEAEATIERLSRFVGETPSRMRVSTDYLACLALWKRAGAAAARSGFDVVLAKTRAMGHGILHRIVLIEGSSSVAPQDEPDTAIPALRALLAEIAPADANGNYLRSLCASRLMLLLGLRGLTDDIAEARHVMQHVVQTRSRFVDYRYALALACIAFGAGQLQDAARIAGLADMLRNKLDANFWFADIFANLHAALLRVIPQEGMMRLWGEGASMTLEEAFRLATVSH